MFTFAIYAASLHAASVEAFGALTSASATAVTLATVTFSTYLILWHEHLHTHPADEAATHPHTSQQHRALEAAGASHGAGRSHVHVHYVGPPALICGAERGAAAAGHGHDHSHEHGHCHA